MGSSQSDTKVSIMSHILSLFPSSKGILITSATEGRWGEVLQLLESLDLERVRRGYLEDYSRAHRDDDDGGSKKKEGNDDDAHAGSAAGGEDKEYSSIVMPLEKAVAMAHEMTILELAEQNEVELAYATLRMCSTMLDRALQVTDENDVDDLLDNRNNNHSNNNLGMI